MHRSTGKSRGRCCRLLVTLHSRDVRVGTIRAALLSGAAKEWSPGEKLNFPHGVTSAVAGAKVSLCEDEVFPVTRCEQSTVDTTHRQEDITTFSCEM